MRRCAPTGRPAALLAAGLLALSPAAACGDGGITATEIPAADLRVLFIGNSLTSHNDLPGTFATIAEAAGHTIAWQAVARPGHSLEDHWARGVADRIRAARADVVVLQQGPSSLPANQEHLRAWTEALDVVIRDSGGRTALLMVWPGLARWEAVDDVATAYGAAAAAVDGLFIPAGEALRRAREADPSLSLLERDGFHPAPLGTVVAALAAYRVLFGRSVGDLPPRMEPRTAGLETIEMDSRTAAIVFEAVEAAVAGGPDGGARPAAGGTRRADGRPQGRWGVAPPPPHTGNPCRAPWRKERSSSSRTTTRTATSSGPFSSTGDSPCRWRRTASRASWPYASGSPTS